MSGDITKGKSPFYPGQPVPGELFVGRAEQIYRIMNRGVGQVAEGKPIAMFVQGDYGIGKSSIASYTHILAERSHGLHGVYAMLGGCKTLSDVIAAILEATLKSGLSPSRSDIIRNWLGRFILEANVFGVKVNARALQDEARELSTPLGMLSFLAEVVGKTGVRGIFLVLDEINGVTADPQFAQFIKALVDANAVSTHPVPLLLMLCGVEARRREMITKHQPIDRIFDVIDIKPMAPSETALFFRSAFETIRVSVEPRAMEHLITYSAGLPKIMHIVGDCAFWANQDEMIDEKDAHAAVLAAADEVGQKFVDQQVLNALRSRAYRSILYKVASLGPDAAGFTTAEVSEGLTADEKKKLNNFQRKMLQLNVIRKGDAQGEYHFHLTLVRMYIWLKSAESTQEQAAG
jgi:hypothetical protein